MQSILIRSRILFSEAAVNELRSLASRFALFCDETVASVLGNRWAEYLRQSGLNLSLFTFSAGEQEKSRARKEMLEDSLLAQKFNRDTCIVALGGGVTTDLIGFLASTYCRGVPLILVPTTLLAAVDAAIGGKTGVNTPFGKNLIGSFYPAEKILIDPSILSRDLNGMAEVIKYGLIHSPELLELRDLEEIVSRCVEIKAEIVAQDPEEKKGYRRILNFGHTIAHAVELLENYEIAHGEAVAIGMLVESCISRKMGLLSAENFSFIAAKIRSFPFSLRINPTPEQIRSVLALDKKSANGKPRFVLLKKIGGCAPFDGDYCTEVPDAILDEALKECSHAAVC